jgi:predicted O-methyltransferase YrrM
MEWTLQTWTSRTYIFEGRCGSSNMATLNQAFFWIRDIAQVLVLDRFDSRRKRIAQAASSACRSLRFHGRSHIPQLPLSEIVGKLSSVQIDDVRLPGPATDLGEVGSQTAYHALGAVAKAVRPSTILEFGTYLGVSALAMALNVPPSCRIYTLDLPENAEPATVPDLNALDKQHIRQSRRRVGEAFLDTKYAAQIIQLREDSMVFRAEKHVQAVDFAYVDGGHSYPVIIKDTENALRVLSPTGVIVWDDYFHLYPDVVRFLDEFSRRHTLYSIAGTNYVVHSQSWANP